VLVRLLDSELFFSGAVKPKTLAALVQDERGEHSVRPSWRKHVRALAGANAFRYSIGRWVFDRVGL